jgi:hypothetical protein
MVFTRILLQGIFEAGNQDNKTSNGWLHCWMSIKSMSCWKSHTFDQGIGNWTRDTPPGWAIQIKLTLEAIEKIIYEISKMDKDWIRKKILYDFIEIGASNYIRFQLCCMNRILLHSNTPKSWQPCQISLSFPTMK